MKNLILLFSLVCVSCSDVLQQQDFSEQDIILSEEEYISIAYDNPKMISQGDAEQMALDFYCGNFFTRSSQHLNIDACSLYYIGDEKDDIQTRSNNHDLMNVPIYKFEVSDGDNKGLIFVAADERVAKVVAYIPNIGDTTDVDRNLMLRLSERTVLDEIENCEYVKAEFRQKTLDMLKSKYQIASFNIDDFKSRIHIARNATRSTPETPVTNPVGMVYPMCDATEWGQGIPYNDSLPKVEIPLFDDMVFMQTVYAGCGVTAMAQILAAIEPVINVYGTQIDWNLLKSQKEVYVNTVSGHHEQSSIEARIMIAKLFKYIYEQSGSYPNYDSKNNFYDLQSATPITGIRDVLRKYCSTGNIISSWDAAAAFSSLLMGELVFVAADGDKENSSHAFIIDGYGYWTPKTRNIIKNFDFYFHVNWGMQGTGTGYYLVNKDASVSFQPTVNGTIYDKNFKMICNIKRK